MKLSLRIKLTLSFVLLILFLFGILGFSANQMLNFQFKQYVIRQQEEKNSSVAKALNDRYLEWGKSWAILDLESFGVDTLNDGLILKIYDVNGDLLWDATVHNSGMCASIIEGMASDMSMNFHSVTGGYTEKKYLLYDNGQVIGSVDIGYYGPYYFNETDRLFLKTLNNLFIIAALIMTLFSSIIVSFIAKRLSAPIEKVNETAKQMVLGNYETRADESSTTLEIFNLSKSINTLASTLETKDQLRKKLTADVAHELRTPLATLQSHMEAMIDGIWEMDIHRLNSCHEEIIRLTSLVSSLENLAKIDSFENIIHYQTIDIKQFLQSILSNFSLLFEQKKICSDLLCESQLIETDPDLLKQICINLISNAINYSDEESKITLEVQITAPLMTLSIKDTGIGISESDLPYIFERFYRVDRSRSRITGGSGIGLTITQSLVHQLGGTIEVQSQVNEGSHFRLLLPTNYQ